MSQYEKLAPNQLIKLIESKDKTLYEQNGIIAEQDTLWTATKAREHRYQGKEGL